MSRNSCDRCGGIQDAHTADCPNRVDDRAVVVGEVLAMLTSWDATHRAHVTAAILAAILAALDGAPATVWTESHDHDPDTEPCLPTCPSRITPGAPA